MADIKITYETLFDLLRREKNREELQTLDKDFYEQVLAYLQEKENLVSRKEDTSYFSADKEKLKIQFQNIRRLVKELYEKREKKIINIALVKARTGSDIIDTGSLLPCEVEFFEDMVQLFAQYKREILDKIINLKEFTGIVRSPSSGRMTAVTDEEGSYQQYNEENASMEVHFKKASPAKPTDDGKKRIKILEYLPKFMGKQGEILGPYEKDSIVDIDLQIAELLVKKGRAQIEG